MNAAPRRGELAGPVLLIGFGTLLYLVNTGQVSLSIWGALAKLWPLALIAVGIDLMLPRRSVLGSITVAAVLLAVVLGGGALAIPAQPSPPAGGEAVNVPSGNVAQARITLSPAAGQLIVSAMETAGPLLAGTITISPPGSVSSDADTTGDTAVVSVSTVGPMIIPMNMGPGEVWDLEISTTPRISLIASLGAGEVRIDGRGLHLTSLDSSLGAGQMEVWVPEGSGPVELSSGVGEIVIRVPGGVPVRILASSLLGVTVPPGYSKSGSEYESPGFQPQGALIISASMGIGSIRVEEYD
jgi:hypothetical protein